MSAMDLVPERSSTGNHQKITLPTRKASVAKASNLNSRPDRDHFRYKEPWILRPRPFLKADRMTAPELLENNPGISLADGPETSKSKSTDNDDYVTFVKQSDEAVLPNVKRIKTVHFEEIDQTESAPTIQVAPGPEVGSESTLASTPDTAGSINSGISDVVSKDDTEAEKDNSIKKFAVISYHDRSDPYNRSPGQIWSKEVQSRHNLEAAIRERGFTGPRVAWLVNRILNPKTRRFEANRRTPVKQPNQTQTEYRAALKKRKEEESASKIRVKEYDEDSRIKDLRLTLKLYDLVYGPDGPDLSAIAKRSATNYADEEYEDEGDDDEGDDDEGDDDEGDDDEEDEDDKDEDDKDEDDKDEDDKDEDDKDEDENKERTTTGRIRCAHGNVLKEKQEAMQRRNPNITILLDQLASPEEIEKHDQDYRASRKAAKRKREDDELREFKRNAAKYQTFSNGFRELWKETAPTKNA